MKFKIYLDAKREYRWRLIGDNNSDVIADSGEGYKNKESMRTIILKIKNAPIDDTTLRVLLPKKQ